eukprot:2799178-Rhodomonas_salina.1
MERLPASKKKAQETQRTERETLNANALNRTPHTHDPNTSKPGLRCIAQSGDRQRTLVPRPACRPCQCRRWPCMSATPTRTSA